MGFQKLNSETLGSTEATCGSRPSSRLGVHLIWRFHTFNLNQFEHFWIILLLKGPNSIDLQRVCLRSQLSGFATGFMSILVAGQDYCTSGPCHIPSPVPVERCFDARFKRLTAEERAELEEMKTSRFDKVQRFPAHDDSHGVRFQRFPAIGAFQKGWTS